MEKEKLGQEPAFPISDKGYPTHLSQISTDTAVGISKRFYAACAAMQGILSNEELRTKILTNVYKVSFECADALLKEENK